MPTVMWIEPGVFAAYLLGLVLVLPRIRRRWARRLYVGVGALLLLFILLQVAAIIYLMFNPIRINLNFR